MKAVPYHIRDDGEQWRWGAEVIAIATEFDDALRKSIGDGNLVPLGEGASSLVYLAPRKGRVVRLTSDTTIPECEVMDDLLGRDVVGWPKVYDMALLSSPEEDAPIPDDWEPEASLCIGIVELVTPAAKMDARTRKYKDIVEAAFAVKRTFPSDPRESFYVKERLTPQAQEWAAQLYDGLIATGRETRDYELDLYNEGNWGLNGEGNAVWVDFGV